jgi:hypothetical protein
MAFRNSIITTKGVPNRLLPTNKNIMEAATHCFDRETGLTVPISRLKTYRKALSNYHLSPESKFENGDRFDCGATRRRYVHVVAIDLHGKESDKWEDQAHLGIDPDSQINYGRLPGSKRYFVEYFRSSLELFDERTLARELNIPRSTVRNYCQGKLGRLSKSKNASIALPARTIAV